MRYFRDIDRREVDSALVEKGRPFLAVECKISPAGMDRNLRYWKARSPNVMPGRPPPSGAQSLDRRAMIYEVFL